MAGKEEKDEGVTIRVKADYLIYTASDPDAGALVKELGDKGFLVLDDGLSDAAMVLVVDAEGKKLSRVLKSIAAREGVTHWRMAKAGRQVKI